MNKHLTDEEVAAYVTGEVNDQEEAKIKTHLSFCPKCKEDVDNVHLDIFGHAYHYVMEEQSQEEHIDYTQLYKLLQGHLPQKEEREVELHIAECEECQESKKTMKIVLKNILTKKKSS